MFQNNITTDGKEDYSDLPPNQKRKKLLAKVQELSKQVCHIQQKGALLITPGISQQKFSRNLNKSITKSYHS